MRTVATLTLCLVLSAFVAGCGGSRPPEEAATPPEPPEPWEWVPDDAKLAEGRVVYLQECDSCHNHGEEGAPRLTSAKIWAERAAKGEAVLIKNAIEGFIGDDGEMPPRGDGDLTDEQVAAAVRYMLAAPNKR